MLIGYLNIGTALEGYQYKVRSTNPIKEMLEMSPKDFYKNSFGLAKKFLGENHSLTQRLSFCNTKNELLLFKDVITTDSSDIEVNRSCKNRLKNMLESIDGNETLSEKRNFDERKLFSRNYTTVIGSPKDFKIRKSPQLKTTKYKKNEHFSTQEDVQDVIENNEDVLLYGGRKHRKYYKSPSPSSHSDRLIQPEKRTRPLSSHSKSEKNLLTFPVAPDQTQILLQVMFHQQKDLEEKLKKKFEKLKASLVIRNPEKCDNEAGSKDDSKIKFLEEQFKVLKEKVTQLNTEQASPPISKARSVRSMASHLSPPVLPELPLTASDSGDNIQKFILDAEDSKNYAAKTRMNGLAVKDYDVKGVNKQISSSTQVLLKNKINLEKDLPSEANYKGVSPLGTLSPIAKNQRFFVDPYQNDHEIQGGMFMQPSGPKDQMVTISDKTTTPSEMTKQKDLNADSTHNQNTTNQQNNDTFNSSDQQKEIFYKLADNSSFRNPGIPKEQIIKASAFAHPGNKNDELETVKLTSDIFSSGSQLKEEEKFTRATTKTKTPDSTAASTSKPLGKIESSDLSAKAEDGIQGSKTKITKEIQTETLSPKKPENKPSEEDAKLGSERSRYRRNSDVNCSISINGEKRNSLSIPTSVDVTDLPREHQYRLRDNSRQTKHAIIRKRIFIGDETQYILTCRIVWGKEEKLFKLQLIGKPKGDNFEEFNKIESELELTYKSLRKILKHVEYKDVMPATFHMKQIKNYYSLARFLLMPFTTVSPYLFLAISLSR